MTNIEKYNNAFISVFNSTAEELGGNYSRETVSSWDSVHQLNVITLLEEAFDIMLEPEDITGLTSYANGIDILKKYNIEL